MSDVNLDIIDAAVANYENKPISRNKIELFIKLSKLEEEEVSNVSIIIYSFSM